MDDGYLLFRGRERCYPNVLFRGSLSQPDDTIRKEEFECHDPKYSDSTRTGYRDKDGRPVHPTRGPTSEPSPDEGDTRKTLNPTPGRRQSRTTRVRANGPMFPHPSLYHVLRPKRDLDRVTTRVGVRESV